MREPHWLAGITNLKLIGGRTTFPAPEFWAFASYEKETQSLDLWKKLNAALRTQLLAYLKQLL